MSLLAAFVSLACSSSGPGELVERETAKLELEVEQHPADPDRRVALSLVYSEAGSQQEAIKQLEQALAMNESHQGALIALGDIYMELGRYADAIERYDAVVEMNEDNPMRTVNRQLEGVLYFRGVAYFNLGKSAEAIASFEEALVIDKTNADTWQGLGAAHQHNGEHEKAIEAYDEAIRFVPNFTEAYQGLALSYEKLGDSNRALYATAMVNYSMGASEQAITQLTAVVAEAPGFSDGYLGLGLTYESQGDTAEALAAYEEALRLDPENWLARMKTQALGGQ